MPPVPPPSPAPPPPEPPPEPANIVVRAFPNPWRADQHGGLSITFDPVKPQSTIEIFSLGGRKVATVAVFGRTASWDLRSESGERVRSGYYFYIAVDEAGGSSRGKLVVIR